MGGEGGGGRGKGESGGGRKGFPGISKSYVALDWQAKKTGLVCEFALDAVVMIRSCTGDCTIAFRRSNMKTRHYFNIKRQLINFLHFQIVLSFGHGWNEAACILEEAEGKIAHSNDDITELSLSFPIHV